MAFSTLAKGSALSLPTKVSSTDAQYRAAAAKVPLRLTPFKAVTSAATGPETAPIPIDGRSHVSVIAYGTAGQTAPSGFHLQAWGSHTNRDGSWVQVGSDITTLGETTFVALYQYLVLYFSTLPTAGSLDVDLAAFRFD